MYHQNPTANDFGSEERRDVEAKASVAQKLLLSVASQLQNTPWGEVDLETWSDMADDVEKAQKQLEAVAERLARLAYAHS